MTEKKNEYCVVKKCPFDLDVKIGQIHGVLFGNPNHEEGLITRIAKMEKDVKNNQKITWAVLLAVLGSIITILIK